ncbi:hypothetical protein P154DRAFT_465970 [Amniculicola lignicola CBS 123094]|uniref:Uncharacterized protein n=1 Tax=Amniculicola lignicola CBS 123094 TaxID=1392246 RepID=A0A6A5WH01_9PLEO|nr:hypothetical protein P154DRAFT_465970 [Amniculicola lignicola CBS 123094]
MPLTLLRAAAGSPYRAFACVFRRVPLCRPTPIAPQLLHPSQPRCLLRTQCPLHRVGSQCTRPRTSNTANLLPHPEAYPSERVSHVRHNTTSSSTVRQALSKRHSLFRLQDRRRKIRARPQSRPALVLDATDSSIRKLYTTPSPLKPDLSYHSRRAQRNVAREKTAKEETATDPKKQPTSLYTILARCLKLRTKFPTGQEQYEFHQHEIQYLQKSGYSAQDVEHWASVIDEKDSRKASSLFSAKRSPPPMFLVLLFLRRRDLVSLALGAVMHHINRRIAEENLTWNALKLLAIRLVRHARRLWPESIPWIASLYTSEASKIGKAGANGKQMSTQMLSELNSFSNTFLSLLSLPCSTHAILSAHHQEKAQFQVLAFMASSDPPLIVTKHGFRAIARVQLAHPKGPQELDWARLKGPNWPPWKENRTGIDEEKGYTYGISRASRILHRMFEAGYPGSTLEDLIQMYAGWDTDFSPTIQTRAMLPTMSSALGDRKNYHSVLWAGRIRTTRTRREAWACFLAFETTKTPANERVYHAMFEKLTAAEVQNGAIDIALVPGDMKEIFPDSDSAMSLVSVSEPIPSFEQLYDRMRHNGISPTKKFLSVLVETSPDCDLTWEILNDLDSQHGGGIRELLDATFSERFAQKLPNHFFAAFIRFLCKSGRFAQSPALQPTIKSTRAHRAHRSLLRDNPVYKVEYAHALLLKFRPRYRPAWTAYMEALIHRPWGHKAIITAKDHALQYRIITKLVDLMHATKLDIDDEQFSLLCIATCRISQSSQSYLRGHESNTTFTFTPGAASTLIRTLFHDLISVDQPTHGSYVTSQEVQPHIESHTPGPATLHAYVRALGALGDYEGLYSFSTWLTQNHKRVTIRAKRQHGGPRILGATIVALRAAMEGWLERGQKPAPPDLVQLVKTQVDGVEEWGGWPRDEEVTTYIRKR